MGPALETMIQYVLIALIIALVALFATRRLWADLWKRLKEWDARDKRKFAEEAVLDEHRRKAEAEVNDWQAQIHVNVDPNVQEQKLDNRERKP